MSQYRVVATEQLPPSRDPRHARIVALYTEGRRGGPERRWPVGQVMTAIDNGDRFFVQQGAEGRRVEVETIDGGPRMGRYLRTHADSSDDNNLNELPIHS
jgi:hypothetical protein